MHVEEMFGNLTPLRMVLDAQGTRVEYNRGKVPLYPVHVHPTARGKLPSFTLGHRISHPLVERIA